MLALQNHPDVKNQSGGQKAHGRKEEGRDFANAYANGKKCGSPNKIDDRESQQRLPRGSMGSGLHGKCLHSLAIGGTDILARLAVRREIQCISA